MSLPTKKPVNYLNNKDILKEIHASKNTYCQYDIPDYHQYDFIVDLSSEEKLEKSLEYASREETIQTAMQSRADRLKIDISEVKKTDIIYRIMTWDHIPVAPKQPRKIIKPKTAKEIFEFEEEPVEIIALGELDAFDDPELDKEMGMNDMVHVRLNFPPFQHFKFDENDCLVCVGKSHWRNNEFSKDHGQITKTLAKMYLMLCEKYALRYNWRSYTYVDEMRASAILQLTYVGLRFNESRSNNPFAYYTTAIKNSFRRVLNMEKRNQNIRDDILQMNNLNPSWTRQYNESGYND